MVTGLEGIVTVRCEYLNGCVQYSIRPPVGADGKLADAYWVDVDQLRVTGLGVTLPDKAVPTGGPQLRGASRKLPSVTRLHARHARGCMPRKPFP